MADCDAVTVVGNLLKQRVVPLVRRGDTCTFLYLDGKSILLDAVHQVLVLESRNRRCHHRVFSVEVRCPHTRSFI